MIKRPMLAATVTSSGLGNLRYPLLGSPKLDGIRCLIHPTLGPVSRSFKPIPNNYIRQQLARTFFEGLDGEIMHIDATGCPYDFNRIQSAVMSHDGEPLFQLWAFDWFMIEKPYKDRYEALKEAFYPTDAKVVVNPLIHTWVHTPNDAQNFASKCLREGYEGCVFRDPEGPYKSGRSTLRQQWMLKYKEFSDAEGTVIDFEEKFHNTNEDEKDNFGLAKRSDKKEGMVAAGTLGALVLDTKWGTLRVGTGFDDAMRQAIWDNRDHYLKKVVTFKYQTFGMQDLPRFPVFLRFREAE